MVTSAIEHHDQPAIVGTPYSGRSALIRGFRIYGFPSREALIRAMDGHQTILMALNAEKLARADPDLQAISKTSVGYADGYGAVLALRRRGIRTPRIAGSDLWLELVKALASHHRFYLVGSTDSVIEDVVTRLRSEMSHITIAGYRNGFLDDAAERDLTRRLAETRSSVVLVAMGSPRQELLMRQLLASWPALYIGLGGSFDVYAGRRPRAPRAVRRIGMEWAHRFVTDPSRLPRLPAYLKFALRLLLNRL